jgi:hypothetical protein
MEPGLSLCCNICHHSCTACEYSFVPSPFPRALTQAMTHTNIIQGGSSQIVDHMYTAFSLTLISPP